jgi:TRAP-type C4-dicarboxylate transport system substrate-binding protein
MKSLTIAISILCAVGYNGPSRADTIKIRFAAPYDEGQPVHEAAMSLGDHLNTQLEGHVEVEVETACSHIILLKTSRV